MTGCTISVGTLVGLGVVLAVGDAVTVEGDGVIVGFNGIAVTAACVELGAEVGEGSIVIEAVRVASVNWQAASSSVTSTKKGMDFVIFPSVQ